MATVTRCEYGTVPASWLDSQGCLAVEVQEYATAQDMMASTCLKMGYAHTLGASSIEDGGGMYYEVGAMGEGKVQAENGLGVRHLQTDKPVWLSDYGNNQDSFEKALSFASLTRPLIVDVELELTDTVSIEKDIWIIGCKPIHLSPFNATAEETAKYYLQIAGTNKVVLDGVEAYSEAIYTPGINILNGDTNGKASNVYLCQVTNVAESFFIGCKVSYASLVRQGTGDKSKNNSLYVSGCIGKMSENFVNAVNGSVHIYNCDIQCSSESSTANGYSEYYHGIYIGAVFFDSEVIGCQFTVGGPSRVSSALHFNDSSGDDHDVNIYCADSTITGYQSGGSFNYGTVVLDSIIMPEGAEGGSLGSALTINTDCYANRIVCLPAAEQYRFIQNNKPCVITLSGCDGRGLSTIFTTTNDNSGSRVHVTGSYFKSYNKNTGSITTMPIVLCAFGYTFENFQNYTTVKQVELIYSNCTLIPNAESGQTYFNLSSGSSMIFTGLIMNSGQIALQGEGSFNIDCIQKLYSGVFNKFTTIGEQ